MAAVITRVSFIYMGFFKHNGNFLRTTEFHKVRMHVKHIYFSYSSKGLFLNHEIL